MKNNIIEKNILMVSDFRLFIGNDFMVNEGNMVNYNVYYKEVD